MNNAAAETMTRILYEVLDQSCFTSGKVTPRVQPFDIREIIGKALDVFAEEAYQKGIELAYYVDPVIPSVIEGDSAIFEKVILNLVENSIKFTSSGEITLEVTCKEIRKFSVLLHTTISDTGIGISDEKKDKIFDLFIPVTETNPSDCENSRMGLAVSRQLSEILNGNLWFESKPGEGSKFHFTAELHLSKDTRDDPDKYLPLWGKKVLITEASDTVKQLLTRSLQEYGVVCHTIDEQDVHHKDSCINRKISNNGPYDVIICHPHPAKKDKKSSEHYMQKLNKNARVIYAVDPINNPVNQSGKANEQRLSIVIKPLRFQELIETMLSAI
jgi:two-component system, sensor histidine kinase and response regulator